MLVRIRVLLFGVLKDLAGQSLIDADFPNGSSVGDVLENSARVWPTIKTLLPSIAVAVNREYATPETKLGEGDEVALLPPVSGGAQTGATLVRKPITTEQVVKAIKRPEDGAVVVFEGVVRNQTRGRKTLFLDYEAHEEMALKQMERLIVQAKSQFGIRTATIVHRLGRIEIGETSVLIVVASAHRAAAFEASRWLIDMLKRTVPIWKKEHFEDGAVWADGELFPEEIVRTR
jgi:molybdopterin synthase catalytic subunit/molybdopterin converting factor small subunit